MRVPPLKIKLLLESNPPESRILVRRQAVPGISALRVARHRPATEDSASAKKTERESCGRVGGEGEGRRWERCWRERWERWERWERGGGWERWEGENGS